MSTKRFSTMPEALLLTSTLVIGWIFPVATTERATSPRATLPIRFGSMELPLTSLASAAPPASTTTTTTTAIQIQKRLLLRDATTTNLPTAPEKPTPFKTQKNRCDRYTSFGRGQPFLPFTTCSTQLATKLFHT